MNIMIYARDVATSTLSVNRNSKSAAILWILNNLLNMYASPIMECERVLWIGKALNTNNVLLLKYKKEYQEEEHEEDKI